VAFFIGHVNHGPPSGGPYPVALAGGGTGYFVDATGSPRFLLADNPWALIQNAGRWNGSGGGTWQQDIDNYCNSRGAQGFTAAYTDPLCNTETGGLNNGDTWDGVWPFNSTSDPSSGFNNTYWQRVDYFVAACARNGMTAWFNIAYTSGGIGDIDGWFNGKTTLQYQNYAIGLAARYASNPNVIWAMGNDYNFAGAPSDNEDPAMSTIWTQLRASGDTHLFTFHPYPESDSTQDFGTGTTGQDPDFFSANSGAPQFTMVYTYQETYFGVEYAYTQTSPLPVIWGDGFFYNGANIGTRQMFWWAAASGARGANTGSEGIWPWPSTAPAAVTSELWFTTHAGIAISLIESLPNWWKLIPDTSNVLITAGRGTRVGSTSSGGGGTQYGSATTNNYVAASRVPDGSLALIYFSGGTTSAQTITIDQTKMMSGYTATWVDPTSGSQFSQTPGSTYNAVTARGNNAAGQADWVLVLQG
jgi:hypothetical protein